VGFRALPRRAFPYLLVAVFGFMVAYVGLFFFAFPADVIPDNMRVPNVVGLSYDEASSTLEKAGFKVLKGDTRYRKATPANQILQQDPPANSLQKRGVDVTLAVSGGQRGATVPAVAGLSQQQARITIENAGFQLGSVMQRTGDQPRGAVIESEPAAGATLQLPAVVNISVSQGPATLQLPDLTGRTLADARSTIEQLGLQVGGTTRDTSSIQPENTVMGQTPAPGQKVSAGGRVSLTISRFPPVPRVEPIDTMPVPDSVSSALKPDVRDGTR